MSVQLSSSQISLFLLVLARVSGVIVSAPMLGDREVPRPVKVCLVVVLSLVLVGVPSISRMPAPEGMLPFSLSVLAQLIIGISMGFVARTVFFVIQTAGGIVSLQSGLSVAAVLNPLTREPDPVLSQLYTVIAVLTFLVFHGDIWVVAALARSFDLTPLSPAAISPTMIGAAVSDALMVTALGLQIAMPIAATLFATNLVLGLVSRSLPQLNLFILSLPLNLLLGLVALIGSLGGTLLVISHLTDNLPRAMLDILPHGH